jgi:hypothetical protein
MVRHAAGSFGAQSVFVATCPAGSDPAVQDTMTLPAPTPSPSVSA